MANLGKSMLPSLPSSPEIDSEDVQHYFPTGADADRPTVLWIILLAFL